MCATFCNLLKLRTAKHYKSMSLFNSNIQLLGLNLKSSEIRSLSFSFRWESIKAIKLREQSAFKTRLFAFIRVIKLEKRIQVYWSL